MAEQLKHTGVVFILLRDDGKLLLQLRDAKDTKFPNQWCFPGGRKDDESHMETVIREAREEYEIVLKPEDCVLLTRYDVSPFVWDNHVFVCRTGNQEAVLHEGAGMAWLDIEEISKLPLGFEQEKFLPLLLAYLKKSGV